MVPKVEKNKFSEKAKKQKLLPLFAIYYNLHVLKMLLGYNTFVYLHLRVISSFFFEF